MDLGCPILDKASTVRTRIMGILNVTPNSFSDGGKYFKIEDAIKQVGKLVSDGTEVIDVGAESTAPASSAITQEEEWERLRDVLPQVINIAHNSGVEVSIDTRNSKTASMALKLGVDYVNDVGGLLDESMPEVMKDSNAKIIIMHHLGIPVSSIKAEWTSQEHLVENITNWLSIRIDTLISHGITEDRIIIDPGIGFGKAPQYSWCIIKNIHKFRKLGRPICIGHSRKSMLSSITENLEDRDFPTALISAFLWNQSVDFIRVHNVSLSKMAIAVAQQLT